MGRMDRFAFRSRKLTNMLSAFLLLAVQDARLDFECKAISLEQALSRLSEQSGTKLLAEGAIRDQIVFIRARDVTLTDLKAKIAEAVVGTWEPRDGKQIIQRLPGQQSAIVREQRELRTKQFEAELVKLEKQLEKPFDAKALAQGLIELGAVPPNPEDRNAQLKHYERKEALENSGAVARLLRRLVLAMKPTDLASVGTYERAIFTLNPTRLQRGFDKAKYEAAVNLYEKEQGAWIEAARSMEFGQSDSRTVSDPRSQLQIDPKNRDFSIAYSRGDMTGLGMANLRGSRQDTGSYGIICQTSLAGPQRDFLNGMMNPKPAPADDPAVNLSEGTKTVLNAIKVMFESRANAPMVPTMLDFLVHPDTKDPLSFLVSDTLTDYAIAKKSNVVASLCDDAFTWSISMSRTQTPRYGLVMQALEKTGSLQIAEKDGWAVMTPANRYESELTFTPRKPLAELMQAMHESSCLDMEQFATFAFRSGRVSRTGISDIYMMLYDRSVASNLDFQDWQALRLYGSLDAKQKPFVLAGESLPLNSLTPEQKRIVERMIYNDEIRSETYQEDNSSMYEAGVIEPTETYSAGLPTGGVLTGRTSSRETVVAYGKGLDGKIKPLRALEPYSLAHIEVDVLGKPEMMGMYGVAGLVGYAPGKSKSVFMRILLEPKVWREVKIKINEYDRKATPGPWNKLPEETVKQIQTLIDEAKKRKASESKSIPPPASQKR